VVAAATAAVGKPDRPEAGTEAPARASRGGFSRLVASDHAPMHDDSVEVDMEFNIGDVVVYPNQGIARVDEIRMIEAGHGPIRFYVLRLDEAGTVVQVPVDNACQVGLRLPIGEAECARLVALLAAPFDVPPALWKDRQKELHEMTRTGDPFATADLLKKLTYLDAKKPLAFGEKRMLERARSLIIAEIALARGKPAADAESMVDHALAAASPRTARAAV
jgi:CarD family transcriptional regulator